MLAWLLLRHAGGSNMAADVGVTEKIEHLKVAEHRPPPHIPESGRSQTPAKDDDTPTSEALSHSSALIRSVGSGC